MKGISAVIATLLMLVITVGLAITAYGFITNMFSQQTERQIEVADASCAPGSNNYYITVRNLDKFNNISLSDISFRLDEVPATPVWLQYSTFQGKNIISFDNTSLASIPCSSAGAPGQPNCVPGTAHRIRVIGPTGRANQLPVSC
jgi:flagellin-like protein